MNKFIRKLVIIILALILFTEVVSRLLFDPFYFYSIDTYNVELASPSIIDVFRHKNTEHVDLLFLGSSRVPATINPSVVMDLTKDKTAVVAGRGYMSAGIHYQAIKNRIREYPGYIEGSKVFLEYPGSSVYTTPFVEDKLKVYEPILEEDKAMPHLLLPHVNFQSFKEFIKESGNSTSVKTHFALQYVFSSYRTISYIKEKFSRLEQVQLFQSSENLKVANEGGIRNDNIDYAIQKADEYRDLQIQKIEDSKPLTFQDLEESTLSYLNELIISNGGELYLFRMPLSSMQAGVFQIDKSRENNKVFEEWLVNKGIMVFGAGDFTYQDKDFPDTWHLSLDRRDEFTTVLMDEVIDFEQ